ncbi:SDR family oxidoreductase [Hamadaea tsunoensis]|uniref:SDR family oxidoreductase n=1 Tax=Hamadaea tsunoensis TaxID=53368 RepID=UPI000484F547|nr:SDR family oxidoreductase [Hamadaea tsunoensis]
MTKIALITGANKGIGFEIARALGRDGNTVLLGARSPERGTAAADALRNENLDAHYLHLDVTDDVSVTAAAKRIEQEWGRLDILVNNAGIARPDGGQRSHDPADWLPSRQGVDSMRSVFEVNVFGVVTVTNAMLPLLRTAAAGRIVNVSSEVGSMSVMLDQTGPLWPMVNLQYPASKAALNMVTVAYAKELWNTEIKVNAVSPGYTATDLNERTGYKTPEAGAAIAVRLALVGEDGPTGGFFDDAGTIAW